jgi:hypothetical protein
MKSIFERLIDGLTRRSPDRDGDEPSQPPHAPEEVHVVAARPEDPYAEMRKALAVTMLLG